ncbi:MAG: hypothetical protein ABL869_10505 [Candidatus Nitrotoga sp.]
MSNQRRFKIDTFLQPGLAEQNEAQPTYRTTGLETHSKLSASSNKSAAGSIGYP